MSKSGTSLLILVICVLGASWAFKIQPRIFNGIPSDRGQHPYYVFLEIDADNSNKQECGGTLVGHRFVITAAHCVDRVVDNIRLHFGVHEVLNTSEEGRKVVTVYPEDIKVHPEFSRRYMRDDVAIITLKEPIEHSRFIQSAKFTDVCVLDEFTDANVVGSGYQHSGGPISQFLQWAPMSKVSAEECHDEFPFLRERPEMFCVASHDVRSVCKGDSGSPLIREPDNVFIGIASFISGEGCEKGLPQAFTKLFAYQNWIADVTGLDIPRCEFDELEDFFNTEFDMYC